MQKIQQFLRFALLSGVGWLCDFGVYSLLVLLTDIGSSSANFISSFVGVTFVYFTSLGYVFRRRDQNRKVFLTSYWAWQAASITAYSVALGLLVASLVNLQLLTELGVNIAIAGKIIITPINLLTNYMFMKWLTRFMTVKNA
ncbi:GtrA family protein [Saccharophagus degradans]|uniref:GtrA family protein n=1 Tax=Saccharophagus degradans TaxID=86304 RepID=A0AAW7X9Q7_9GAMM|nr:GtrA family protein [Saccharophagus degradans]MBU2984597.1 GtrA family protein [Saccharophagus degradans]MDO6423503.1 GtrA family protein [Saccharophagus degradans]MDO6606908.1 GtrA family protein [Saccharophagus degradans]